MADAAEDDRGQDPRLQAEKYLEDHRIPQLFEAMTAQLLYQQPPNPKEFLCRYLEQVKVAGTPALLTRDDLETMFSMFDITNKGAITVEQANGALQTVMGPGAALEDVASGSYLKKDQFVAAMSKALAAAEPYQRR